MQTAPLSYFTRKDIQKCIHYDKLTPKQQAEWYEKNKRTCLYCGKDIPLNDTNIAKYKERKFCNSSCSALYNNKLRQKKYKTCKNCGKEISIKNTYCSNKCKSEYEQKEWEKKWFAGEVSGNTNAIYTEASSRVRTYLFNKYNSKCARCGWGEINPYTGNVPLEVEHIDGNPFSTTPDNVTLLCPNCHSLTSTYKGANKGRGRVRKYVQNLQNSS